MHQLTIKASVGINGENHHSDVMSVQTALNQIIDKIKPTETLTVDGSLGSKQELSKTVAAIKVFQQNLVGLSHPDGRIDVNGKSHKCLNQVLQSEESEPTSQTTVSDQDENTRQSEPRVEQKTPWMNTAYEQLGQVEIAGSKANPQILEYFKAAKFWGTDDSGGANAWCASFVAWVMKENGYEAVENAFRAKEWANFGKTINQPVYGAIGVKTRRGGGHVAFVVGQSSDGQYLFMLGGNQGDMVQIKKYPLSVWSAFVVPNDYNTDGIELPIYTKAAADAGRED